MTSPKQCCVCVTDTLRAENELSLLKCGWTRVWWRVTFFVLGFIVHVEGKKKILCLQLHSEAAVLTGSMEERWSLEIQDKGRVTCPTCRAVVRKTVEGLKKHMLNCRQVRTREMSKVSFTPLQLTDRMPAHWFVLHLQPVSSHHHVSKSPFYIFKRLHLVLCA